MQVKKQQLEPDMEQQTGSKLGNDYIKAVLSPHLFNFYAEYIIWYVGQNESQAGMKIAGSNINNLKCADDTTLNGRKQRASWWGWKWRVKKLA